MQIDRLSVKSQDAYVNIVTRGDLSSLQWIQLPLTNNHTYPSQVTCNVVYSSLNFKDVMLATGKLPAGSIPGNYHFISLVCHELKSLLRNDNIIFNFPIPNIGQNHCFLVFVGRGPNCGLAFAESIFIFLADTLYKDFVTLYDFLGYKLNEN